MDLLPRDSIRDNNNLNEDNNIDTIEDTATLAQQDLELFQGLCSQLEELKNTLQFEGKALRDVFLKDYDRLQDLKGALAVTDELCGGCARSLATLNSHIGELRHELSCVASTLEEKLTTEGSRSWLTQKDPPEKDDNYLSTENTCPDTNSDNEYEKRAEQKEYVARAANARSVAARTQVEVSMLLERAANLEAEAADAAANTVHASREADSAARRAEESRKAAITKAQAELHQKAKEERLRKAEVEHRKQEMLRRATVEEERLIKNSEVSPVDPDTWPQYVYSIDAGDLDVPIGCVVRALPGSLSRDDVLVTTLSQLDDVLPLADHEELVSHIIQLSPAEENENFKIETPLAVALPHVAPRNLAKEVIVKMRLSSGLWIEIDSYDVIIDDINEFKFVEVRVRDLCGLAVLTRYRKDTAVLTRKGGKLLSSVDSRVALMARSGTVREPTDVTFEVHPVDLLVVSEIKIRYPAVAEHLLSSSPVVSMLMPIKKFGKAASVSVPVPPPPHKPRQRPKTAIPVAEGNSARPGSQGDKSARNLPRPASAIYIVSNTKEEELRDFLHLVTWDPMEQAWAKVPDVVFTQPKCKDVTAFECHDPSILKKFLILRTRAALGDSEVCKVAATLEEALLQRVVQLAVRQFCDDPSQVTLMCTPMHKADRLLKKLESEGFAIGPHPCSDVLVREGEKLEVRFRGNIKDTGDETLQVVFNSHFRTKLVFSVTEIDKFAQRAIECYRGFTKIYTVGQAGHMDDTEENGNKETGTDTDTGTETPCGHVFRTEMLVSLPKPEPEPPKPLIKAPVGIKSEGVVNETLLCHLAADIGDEWRELATYLNVRPMRIQAILRNNMNKPQQDAVHEMLLTWAKRLPRFVNKVDLLCQALRRVGRVDIVEELRNRETDYRKDLSQLNMDSLMHSAFVKLAHDPQVIADWKFLPRHLEVSEEDLEEIEQTYPGYGERCVQSLLRWRERAGTTGTPEVLIKNLRRCRYHRARQEVNIVFGIDVHQTPAMRRRRRTGLKIRR